MWCFTLSWINYMMFYFFMNKLYDVLLMISKWSFSGLSGSHHSHPKERRSDYRSSKSRQCLHVFITVKEFCTMILEVKLSLARFICTLLNDYGRGLFKSGLGTKLGDGSQHDNTPISTTISGMKTIVYLTILQVRDYFLLP